MLNIIIFILLNFSKEDILKNSNLQYNKKIEKVTEEINNYILKNNKTIPQKFLNSRLNENDIYSYKYLPFTYSINEKDLYDKIKIDLSMNKKEYNQVGISISKKYITMLLLDNRLNISVMGDRKQYKYIVINGTVTDKQRVLYLYIKNPNYNIKKLIIPIINNRFKVKYKLRQKGKYIFEFIKNNKNDPKIIAKIPIVIGKKNIEESCEINNKEELLYEINKIRKQNSLKSLFLNEELSLVAKKYSKEMAINSFFSHNGLNNSTPYKRVLKSGVAFKKILENISKGSTLCMTHQEIINSPGHLRNILDKDIDKVGIGIFKYKNNIYLTENFIKSKKVVLSIKRIETKLITSIKKRNRYITNDIYLNQVASIKNSNEFLKINSQKNSKLIVNNYSKIESYFFIIRSFQDIIKIVDNITHFQYFGIDIKKFKVKDKDLIFISIILANR